MYVGEYLYVSCLWMCVRICMLAFYGCAWVFVCERFMDVRECLHVSVSCMCVSICM